MNNLRLYTCAPILYQWHLYTLSSFMYLAYPHCFQYKLERMKHYDDLNHPRWSQTLDKCGRPRMLWRGSRRCRDEKKNNIRHCIKKRIKSSTYKETDKSRMLSVCPLYCRTSVPLRASIKRTMPSREAVKSMCECLGCQSILTMPAPAGWS